MYFMHSFDELVGKQIRGTSSCLFSSRSGETSYRALFHLTQDHGILLFGVQACNADNEPIRSNVVASNLEILLCALEASFHSALLRLGINEKEARECAAELLTARKKAYAKTLLKFFSCPAGKE